jgi:hypothetical protein
VQVLTWDHYVASSPQIYEPSLMILAQGSKLARLGRAPWSTAPGIT